MKNDSFLTFIWKKSVLLYEIRYHIHCISFLFVNDIAINLCCRYSVMLQEFCSLRSTPKVASKAVEANIYSSTS